MLTGLLMIAFIIFIAILFVDIMSMTYLKKKLKDNDNNSLTTDYYQLRLQIKSLQIGLIIAGFAVALYGWNIKSTLSQELKSEVISSINLDSLKNFIDTTYTKVLAKRNNLDSEFYKASEILNKIENQSKNVSRTFPYLITDIFTDLEQGSKKLYFNTLTPLNSNKLPKFSKPPFVLISATNGLSVGIGELTKDYIEIVTIGGLYNENTPIKGKVSLWIVERF